MRLVLLWLLLATLWSGSYSAIKVGLIDFGPLSIVAGRMLLGALLLYLVLRFRAERLSFAPQVLICYAVSACFGNVLPFLLIGYGELHVESGLAALLMGIAPVVTVVIAPMLIPGERLTARIVVGLLCGIAGLVTLIGASALSGLGAHVVGQCAILCAALCYAGTTLYVRRFVSLPPLQMATGSLIFGAIPITAAAFIFEAPLAGPLPDVGPVAALLYLGVGPTAIATLIYFHLIPHIGAGRLQQINFLVPALGTLFGIVLLNEPLTPNVLLALGMISVAVYFVSVGRKTPAGSQGKPA